MSHMLKILCNGDEQLVEIVSKMAGVKNVSIIYIGITICFNHLIQSYYTSIFSFSCICHQSK